MPKSEDGAIYPDCEIAIDAEKTQTKSLHKILIERFAELRSVLLDYPESEEITPPKVIRFKEANLPYGQQPGGDQ